MSDELHALEAWVGTLLARLQPAARWRITRKIADELRRRQQQRIAQQRHPDHTAFAPRKARAPLSFKKQRPEKTGRLRRKRRAMFVKLRTARFLKVESDARSLAIGFTGRVARLARVHQYGERDRVVPGGPTYHYPARVLLGFTPEEREIIRDRLIVHLKAAHRQT